MYLRKCLVLVYGAMVIPFVGISADNVNVALHKPVIASSQQKEFPASNVTDGVRVLLPGQVPKVLVPRIFWILNCKNIMISTG